MPRTFRLGKDAVFTFSNTVSNDDVNEVNVTQEAAAEADVSARGSGDQQETVLVRKNVAFEVQVLNHSCTHGCTGTITCTVSPSGPAYPTSGVWQVRSISDPQPLDDKIVTTLTFRKIPS
ncbi:MAG: hypothetical protein EBR82_31245 [Caulobacteraceae bacterium]|nr:hypothetical protein [Caulobacteraceae bacterium]